MSNPSQTSEKLKEMSLFAEFTDNELEAFLDLVEPINVKPGDLIVKQDDHGDCMFVLTSGRGKVKHHRDGKDFELAELKPGEFFGEIALVDEGPRSADVEAIDDCELMRIPHAMLRALAGVYPSAASCGSSALVTVNAPCVVGEPSVFSALSGISPVSHISVPRGCTIR